MDLTENRLEKTSSGYVIYPTAQIEVSYETRPWSDKRQRWIKLRAFPIWVLKASQDGNYTISKSHLSQCLAFLCNFSPYIQFELHFSFACCLSSFSMHPLQNLVSEKWVYFSRKPFENLCSEDLINLPKKHMEIFRNF